MKRKPLLTCALCLSVAAVMSVSAFAASHSETVTLETYQTSAQTAETAPSRSTANVSGKVFADSMHTIVYHAQSRKNAKGVFFDRETQHIKDSNQDEEVRLSANPLGNDTWRLVIEPNGPLYTGGHANGTISN